MLEARIPSTLTDPSVAAHLTTIKSWDLAEARRFLCHHWGKDEREALEMEEEYRKFMSVVAVYPGDRHTISIEVDDFWHAHVLITKDYASFCDRVFGRFIHHVPLMGSGAAEYLGAQFAANTIPHLTELFGTPDPKFWNRSAVVCVCTE